MFLTHNKIKYIIVSNKGPVQKVKHQETERENHPEMMMFALLWHVVFIGYLARVSNQTAISS